MSMGYFGEHATVFMHDADPDEVARRRAAGEQCVVLPRPAYLDAQEARERDPRCENCRATTDVSEPPLLCGRCLEREVRELDSDIGWIERRLARIPLGVDGSGLHVKTATELGRDRFLHLRLETLRSMRDRLAKRWEEQP